MAKIGDHDPDVGATDVHADGDAGCREQRDEGGRATAGAGTRLGPVVNQGAPPKVADQSGDRRPR